MLQKKKVLHLKLITAFQVSFLVGLIIITLVSVFNLRVVREYFSRASGQSASISIDVQSDLGPMPRPWRNLAQGGEAFDWDMTPIVPKVRALNPDYIRIDHIYDFYEIVNRDGSGQLTFDFSKLDPVLEDIKATGATPFIALSYMPPVLAKDDIVSEPKNWEEWQLTVQKTIEHISGTRGFSNVYYEVWNEPDLFGKWSRSGDRNYLTLYLYSSRGARLAKGVRPFKLGGPAITALYKNWFYDFMGYARRNNLKLDFFSWHRYNFKIERFQEDILEVQSWMQDFPEYGGMEMVISEWGHNSENDPGYDNALGAAHTVATSIEMIGSISKAFVFEIEDGKDPKGQARWGRWGLLTHQSHGAEVKPRYSALRLLDRIGATRLVSTGNGSWVKAAAGRSIDDTVTVVLANYDASGRNVETVPITFNNLFNGSYTLKQSFLNRNPTSSLIQVSDFRTTTQLTMPANSVAFIELIRNPDPVASPSAVPTATSSGQVATPSASPTPFAPPISTSSALPTSRPFFTSPSNSPSLTLPTPSLTIQPLF